MRRRLILAFALLPIVVLACRTGRANSDQNGPVAKCPRNEAILASGRSISDQDPTVREAYDHIRFCGDPIGALARAWNNPPTDTFTLEILRERSAHQWDRRMLAIVRPIATDATRPPLLRFAALGTLVQLSQPCRILTTRAWASPEISSLATRDHCADTPGEQPVTQADRDSILALFTRMAESDPDARVRAVSRSVKLALTPIVHPPLAGRFHWTHVNEIPAPVEWPPNSGATLVAGFLELSDSTARPRRFTLGFTFRRTASDSARSQAHGGTFRVSGDTLLFTNDGQEGRPPVTFVYSWMLKDLVLRDTQGHRWLYAPAPAR